MCTVYARNSTFYDRSVDCIPVCMICRRQNFMRVIWPWDYNQRKPWKYNVWTRTIPLCSYRAKGEAILRKPAKSWAIVQSGGVNPVLKSFSVDAEGREMVDAHRNRTVAVGTSQRESWAQTYPGLIAPPLQKNDRFHLHCQLIPQFTLSWQYQRHRTLGIYLARYCFLFSK